MEPQQRLVFPHWITLPVILCVLVAFLSWSDWLARWDQLLYDTQLRLWTKPPPDDIIIVAIDEESLAQFGRWPWPRRLHAELVRRLSESGATIIGLDIIFADPDLGDLEGDQLLANAVNDSGNVVLPIMAEQTRLAGPLVEILPIPILSQATAALGHTHIELDTDGIARSVYLKAGLGQPRWPHFTVALAQVAGRAPQPLPGTRAAIQSSPSPYVWERDHHVLIPFSGPPGHFPRISYAQVLTGNYSAQTFQDKTVLVGVTATALGDVLPSPVSGFGQPMSGVEINANILASLRKGDVVEPTTSVERLMISLVIALLPAFLFPLLSPRAALVTTVVLVTATFAVTMLLLHKWLIWYPPSAVSLVLALSYPLWSWRRLEFTVKYLNQQLARLHSEPEFLPATSHRDIDEAMSFLGMLLPIKGWALYSPDGSRRADWGHFPQARPPMHLAIDWTTTAGGLWRGIQRNGTWQLHVNWTSGSLPTDKETTVLLSLIEPLTYADEVKPRTTVEVVLARIQEAQEATERLQRMRRFIGDSLSQMADGVLVTSNVGQVLIANPQAATYFGLGKTDLPNYTLIDLLDRLRYSETQGWREGIARVLLKDETMQRQAKNQTGRDLLIQVAPLAVTESHVGGLIVNLSDITPLTISERKRAELLGFLSHDLRAPLVSLLALLELTRSGESRASQEDFVNHVERYARRTLDLADDFVQLSRAESGEALTSEDLDLVTVASNAMDQVWSQARRKHIEVESDFVAPFAWVRGDPSLLERAVINLLTNAIKYSPEKTTINLTINMDKERVRCCVKDNGYGIPAEELPKLFDRFRRVQSYQHQQEPGSGLGLAFVKAVMETHDGHVSVSSQIDKGSEFCLEMPYVNDPTEN